LNIWLSLVVVVGVLTCLAALVVVDTELQLVMRLLWGLQLPLRLALAVLELVVHIVLVTGVAIQFLELLLQQAVVAVKPVLVTNQQLQAALAVVAHLKST
jgi:hypothetical protein